MDLKTLRVVIAGDNASIRFGGESILPFHYFRLLNERGMETWLVTHARCREEMEALLPQYKDKMSFIEDNRFELWLFKLQSHPWLKWMNLIPIWLRHLIYQWKQKKNIKKLVDAKKIDIVHQVIPVSPRLPSLVFNVGAPVIIGPMNGGMEYPKNFEHLSSLFDLILYKYARWCAPLLNALLPGKRRAALLIVANERTKKALPVNDHVPVAYLVENGVDLNIWHADSLRPSDKTRSVKFVFLGRLIRWKCVKYLLKAFEKITPDINGELHIIGDGPLRQELTHMATEINGQIYFHGYVDWRECPTYLRQCDVLVLPSMYECGGAVVLEGMISGLPIIATAWGGPIDYLDSSCGILVKPTNEEQFITLLAEAMLKLAKSPQLRFEMGKAGQQKALTQFSWNQKIDHLLKLYQQVVK